MPPQPPLTERHVDRDGVTRVVERRLRQGRPYLAALALVLGGLCVALVVWMLAVTRGPRGSARAAALPAAGPTGDEPSSSASRGARSGGAERSGFAFIFGGSEDDPPEDTAMASDTGGGRSGISVFPPPGTKPIKRGIVVPDDFPLPPGYVRHYQSTDDGQLLSAILMFHPDYKPLDKHGIPIPLPEDRVVPPELAPPGLPLKTLEVPEKKSGGEAGDDKEPSP